MSKTIEIKTKRLTIRTFLPGDEIQIHEYAGDPSITMMYWLPNRTFEETTAYVQRIINEHNMGLSKNLDFVILYENRIIGGIDLHFEDDTSAYMGWVIHKDFRGMGFCTEAAIAVRNYGFNVCGLERIMADCDARNLNSANVMKNIGMQLVDDKGTRTYPKTGITATEHMYEINKLNPPKYQIVEYFEQDSQFQQIILNQLRVRKDLWGAIPVLCNFLEKEGTAPISPIDGGFHQIFGKGKLFLMVDEANKTEVCVGNEEGVCPRLASFISLCYKDEVDISQPEYSHWTPWTGFVFTYPEYRGQRLTSKLIYYAEKIAIKDFQAKYLYISTDHIGFYENIGFEFVENADTIWGDKTRVLRRKVK